MMEVLLSKLDELYIRYGYEPRENEKARIYLFTKSIYNGADIVDIGDLESAEEIKNEYANLGYAVKIRVFKSIEEAEDTLFRDFFKSDGVIHNLKRKYELFVNKLMDNLPENAKYKYINSSYDYTEYSISNEVKTEFHDGSESDLVYKIVDQIHNHEGPLLTIIEAAAGYGKTCTAYEILNEFISVSPNKLPFFTELSRDRKATIFKHILQFEIEEQFSNRVDSNVVIQQIKKGRVPLIIDGFDELISKDFSFSTNQFEQVESMLSTIVELLTDNAKVIITSRKTAIFNSEEFHNWMLDRDIDYTLNKVTISEPSIENWLPKERFNIITKNSFPLEYIANPVLLTYLRYVNLTDLGTMVIENKSIVDSYFNFLLLREQTRQSLLIEPENQLIIFRKLVEIFTEWDVKSESKAFVKEILLDYNRAILDETRKKYTPDKRPRIDQLADILSNHAFLDRKEKGLIGMVNEFVLGTLIGENLILGNYLKTNRLFYKNISQMFALLAVQAFQVQPKELKLKLWEIFNEYPFDFEPQFFFKIEVEFKNEILRNYTNAILNGFILKQINFININQYDTTTFTDCVFNDCTFSYLAFTNCTFVNCKFYNCTIEEGEKLNSESHFIFYGCFDDNDFIRKTQDNDEIENSEALILEKEVLNLYFKKGSSKPRHRQLSQIKIELIDFDFKMISKIINKLKSEEIIYLDGDLTHLTKKGISLYNEKYKIEKR